MKLGRVISFSRIQQVLGYDCSSRWELPIDSRVVLDTTSEALNGVWGIGDDLAHIWIFLGFSNLDLSQEFIGSKA